MDVGDFAGAAVAPSPALLRSPATAQPQGAPSYAAASLAAAAPSFTLKVMARHSTPCLAGGRRVRFEELFVAFVRRLPGHSRRHPLPIILHAGVNHNLGLLQHQDLLLGPHAPSPGGGAWGGARFLLHATPPGTPEALQSCRGAARGSI